MLTVDIGHWNSDGSWTCGLCRQLYRGYGFIQNHREWHVLAPKMKPPTMAQLLADDGPAVAKKPKPRAKVARKTRPVQWGPIE